MTTPYEKLKLMFKIKYNPFCCVIHEIGELSLRLPETGDVIGGRLSSKAVSCVKDKFMRALLDELVVDEFSVGDGSLIVSCSLVLDYQYNEAAVLRSAGFKRVRSFRNTRSGNMVTIYHMVLGRKQAAMYINKKRE